MNGELNSHQSELLHAYLDGELTSTEEHVLFSGLAESEDLRSEMRDLLAIRNAIHSDKDAFTPPLAATAAIFAGLGFAAPSTATALAPAPVPVPAPPIDPVSTGAAGFFGSVARPLVKPFLGALAGSALTATVVTTMMNDGQQPQNTQPVGMQPPAIQFIQEAPPAQVLSDLWIDVSQPPADAGTPTQAAVTPESETNRFDRIPIQYSEPQQTKRLTAADLGGTTEEIRAIAETYFGSEIAPRDRFMVQLLNAPVVFSNPSSKEPSQADPYLMNMRGSVFYIVDDHHMFGLEAGRENFAQVFTEPLSFGKVAHYDQNPIAWWITAAYRYQTGQLIEVPGLRGFFQANLGGALQLGPLGRGLVGLQYDIAPGLLFQVGAEGSMMVYKLEKNYFTTRKLGLMYGLSMQF